MRKKTKKACRGNGRPSDAVCHGRRRDCNSASSQPTTDAVESVECSRLLEVAQWAAYLHGTEVAVLLALLPLPPKDGTPFSARYRDIVQRAGLANALCAHALRKLRASGLLELVERGNAGRANRYRIPARFPKAGEIAVQAPHEKGGEA